MIRYEDSKLLQLADILSTLISSALPIGSIIALYYINTMIVRLVVIAVFTMTFSMVLSLMTSARKVDVFAATAAYVCIGTVVTILLMMIRRFSAVQVVFVSGTSPIGARLS